MPEEILVGLFVGFWMGAPIGWFMKSAFTWRRDAKRLANSEPKPVASPEASAPGMNARMESLMERLAQRLETVEDRLEFTERLLDARTGGARKTAARRIPPSSPGSEGRPPE